MKQLYKNNTILFIIRYIPSLLLLSISLIVSIMIFNGYKKDLEINKKTFKENFIKNNRADIQSKVLQANNYINNRFNQSNKKLKANLKTQVKLAHQIMSSIYERYEKTKTPHEIKEIIKNVLRGIRFNNGRSYFFIQTMDGISVLHPLFPLEEGTNISVKKDKNGIQRFNVLKESVLNKDGFAKFHFFYPNEIKKQKNKLLYVEHFQPLNLMIGTGEYIEDFERDLKTEILHHLSSITYKGDGYLFVIKKDGEVLVSNKGEFNGRDIKDLPSLDKALNSFLLSKDKSKFIQYKINNKKSEYLKTSFVKKIPDFNWIIGTGFDLGKLNTMISENESLILKEYEGKVKVLLLSSFILTLFLLIISFLISKILEKKFLLHEEQLVESEIKHYDFLLHNLREILDNLPMMIIYKDTKNNILTVNQKTADSLNKSIEQLSNVKSKDIFPNDYEKYYKDDLEIINSKKEKIGIIEKYETQNGEKIIETSKIPIFDKNGDVKNIITFINDITDKVQKEKSLQETSKKLFEEEIFRAENYEQTISSLVELIEQRDLYTAGHSNRVAEYAIKIAKELNFSSHDIIILKQIGLLHDIGKIGIPDSILLKPGRLTDKEYDIIKSHVILGYNMISKIPMFKDFANIILSHHERYDGSGYPNGLQGDEIPLLASVLSVADSFDAMTTTRIYNNKITVTKALEEIEKDAGILFHPKVVKVAIKVLENINIDSHNSQLPTTAIEKERFAYFFKDVLTDLSNESYLKLLLSKDAMKQQYLVLFVIHGFSIYNEKFGWENGDQMLIDISILMKEKYKVDNISRFHGTNFILLNDSPIDINFSMTKEYLSGHELTCEVFHFDTCNFTNNYTLFQELSR